MDSNRHNKAGEIFVEARGKVRDERDAFLDEACGGDEALRREVESLLANDVDDADPTTAAPYRESREAAGVTPRAIGPYRVLHELGRGGMGVVYLGVREGDQFKRPVAIKVLKRGLDTEDVLRRFDLERQVLATLNHPGVARLYDGGETDEGLPYFVMEHVEGLDLTGYCDKHRLNIDERLKLFQKVCEAVHYAHQNLVVHRDLKPRNIAVTEDGQPKLLDFGIAKIISPELSLLIGDPTAPGARAMTPEYASPEQVRGDPITTASDVYALGVLLYELLCGHRPYHLHSRVAAEVERVICEEEPDKPSTAITRIEEVEDLGTDTGTHTITPESVGKTRAAKPERLRKILAGDIDNIVLAAMRKEPQRRYPSAEQMAADIQRHIDGMPVTARPDTWTYRASKFVRRNRSGVAAAAAIVLLLVAGITATTIQWRRAEVERGRAETERGRADARATEARNAARRFVDELPRRIEALDGALPGRELLAETAIEILDGLDMESIDDPELRLDIARGYDRLGGVRGGARNRTQGDDAAALASYRKALALREQVVAARPDDLEAQRSVAVSHIRIGDVLGRRGEVGESLGSYRTAVSVLKPLLLQHPDATQLQRNHGTALNGVGKMLARSGDVKGAIEIYEELSSVRRGLVEANPDDPKLRRDLSLVLLYLGTRLQRTSRADEGVGMLEEAVALRKALVDSNPENSRWRRDLAMARRDLANAYRAHRRIDEAVEHLETALATMRRDSERNPQDARARRDVAILLDSAGASYGAKKDWNRALEAYEEGRTIIEALRRDDPARTDYAYQLGLFRENAAETYEAMGDRDKAREAAGAALSVYRRLAEDENDARARESVVYALAILGRLHAASGRHDLAVASFEEARATTGTATPELLRDLAEAHHGAGDSARAITIADEALRLLEGRSDAPRLRESLDEARERYRAQAHE